MEGAALADPRNTVSAERSILGRTVVVHLSDGTRAACGVIVVGSAATTPPTLSPTAAPTTATTQLISFNMLVFGYSELETKDVRPSFEAAIANVTGVPARQVSVSSVETECQAVCKSTGANTAMVASVSVRAVGPAEQRTANALIDDLQSSDTSVGGEKYTAQQAFKEQFSSRLGERSTALVAAFELNSVSDVVTSTVVETSAPGAPDTGNTDGDSGGAGAGMIAGVVIVVVAVFGVGGVLVYQQATKKEVVHGTAGKSTMVDNPMSSSGPSMADDVVLG
jgi:hypothetical protein